MLSDIVEVFKNYENNIELNNNKHKNKNCCTIIDLIACILIKYDKVDEEMETNKIYDIMINDPTIYEGLTWIINKNQFSEIILDILPYSFFEYMFKNINDKQILIKFLKNLNKSLSDEHPLNNAYKFVIDFILSNVNENITFNDLIKLFVEELDKNKNFIILLAWLIISDNYFIKHEFCLSSEIIPEDIDGVIFILLLKSFECLGFNALLSIVLNNMKDNDKLFIVHKLYAQTVNKLLHITETDKIENYVLFASFHPRGVNEDKLTEILITLKESKIDFAPSCDNKNYLKYLFNYLAVNTIITNDKEFIIMLSNFVKSINSKILYNFEGKLIINDLIFNIINESMTEKRLGTMILSSNLTYDEQLIFIYRDINKDKIKEEIKENEKKRKLFRSSGRRLIRT